MTLAQAGESGMGKPVPLFLRCQGLRGASPKLIHAAVPLFAELDVDLLARHRVHQPAHLDSSPMCFA